MDRGKQHASSPVHVEGFALLLIQEGLRGVVRMPSGTAHALDARGFPIAVMGKTGTTNEFRDALFVGSTYGPAGITIAVRIGFEPFAGSKRNWRPGCASRVQRNRAQRLRRKAGRTCADVS